MRSFSLALAVAVLVAATPLAAAADRSGSTPGRCANGRSKSAATWYSIAHPGLGEWYLKGWGPLERAPQKKFWLGFIPIYGWPGYLQVKSAIDANHCRTNDDLRFRS